MITNISKLLGDELIYSDDLMKAISKNDILKCKELLSHSPVLPSWDKYFFHPLLLAAKKGRYEILEVLLDNGIEIDIQDKKGFNALHYSIQQRCVRCCNLLIDRNININLQDKFGNLPLHIAASEGILEIVARLLELNQKPNARNKKDQTPLHFACIKGHEEILSLLLEKGGRWDLKDINFWLPLHCSAFHGHYRCCDILVQASGSRFKEHINMKNKDKGTPLILAAKKGHSRCCQSLKEADINQCDNRGNTALHLAASVSFLKTVEVLIEMKPDVTIRNKDGNTVNPGLNNLNQTVIHMAALNNSEECLKYLLSIPEFKNEINAQDNHGKTALHLALNQNYSEVSDILVTSGIDYAVKDDKGNVPLHVAAGGGIFSICKLLLSGERVQKVNDRNFMGTTPLHLVAMNGSVDCCKLLLTKGADLNAIDSNGFSPFHIAANEGNLEVLKLLIKKGGGFINQVVEISGESCLHLAARKGFYNCCVFILNNMKKDFIIKLNDKENSALDEAYNAEHEEIFHLILSKIPMPNVNEKFNMEQYYPFQYSLHSYMHEALANGRDCLIKGVTFFLRTRLIARAIVESSWWFCGFSSSFCDSGQCPNLVNLTKENRNLTEMVYQKCVEVNDSYTKYNFQIFEDFYYLPLKRPSPDSFLKRESPFSPETGKLLKDVVPFKKHNGHPLYVAAELEHMNLMQHPLSIAYLNHKWVSYMRTILLGSVFSEVLLVLFLSLYLSFVVSSLEY
ncbi:Ankyrin-1 [Armadillidium vulgare]|nr:Ankyrin-1 [Armadillidium vulgare]